MKNKNQTKNPTECSLKTPPPNSDSGAPDAQPEPCPESVPPAHSPLVVPRQAVLGTRHEGGTLDGGHAAYWCLDPCTSAELTAFRYFRTVRWAFSKHHHESSTQLPPAIATRMRFRNAQYVPLSGPYKNDPQERQHFQFLASKIRHLHPPPPQEWLE